jgi:hypothetical protein
VNPVTVIVRLLYHVIQLILNGWNLPHPHQNKTNHACNQIQKVFDQLSFWHESPPSCDRRPAKIEANSGQQSSTQFRQYNDASKTIPPAREDSEEIPGGSLRLDEGGHSDEPTDEGGDSHDPEDREDEHPTADMRTTLSSAIRGIVSHSLLLQQHLGSLLLVLNGRSHKTKDEASKATA